MEATLATNPNLFHTTVVGLFILFPLSTHTLLLSMHPLEQAIVSCVTRISPKPTPSFGLLVVVSFKLRTLMREQGTSRIIRSLVGPEDGEDDEDDNHDMALSQSVDDSTDQPEEDDLSSSADDAQVSTIIIAPLL